ncbi:hypothetical protein [Luteimonas aquatica]|uniref:hypothetical protein n=1 Tax=Luteimonas aquatica TaxID=450364 RepID=UPI001F561C9B|nr:hypothetical protein [Luteimonas aquatica]
MKTKKLLTTVAVLLLALSTSFVASADGAKGGEKYSMAFLRSNLVEGKTTMDEAKRKLGKPADIRRTSSSEGDSERWTYNKNREGGRGLLSRFGKIAGGVHDAIGGSVGSAVASNAAGSASSSVGGVDDVREGMSGESRDFNTIELYFENGVLRRYELSKE